MKLMKSLNVSYVGQSRWWWVVLVIGILLIVSGFAYWIWPVIGFAISSQIFGWLLVMAGIVQLCVAAGPNHGSGWGWWIAGGIIDMFIGFMMVRSIILSEAVLPYFLAIIFIYWGVEAFIGAAMRRHARWWWIGLINGILLSIIGFLFLESGWTTNMMMVSFLTSIAFIYWGFTVSLAAYQMRPLPEE